MKKVNIHYITGIILLIIGGCSTPKEVIEMQLTMPELQQAKSGSYCGSASTKMVKAEIAVAIRNKRIQNIEVIKHETGIGKKAETLTDSVIRYQTVELDVVSGATVSSKIILKAIENALNKSIKE